MQSKSIIHAGLIASLIAIFPTQSFAQSLAINPTPETNPSWDFATADFRSTESIVVGWRFDVTSDIWVTDLGWWASYDGQLYSSHEVGIWNADTGSLLASTTVQASDPATLGFHFDEVSITQLTPGVDYIIAALAPVTGEGPSPTYTDYYSIYIEASTDDGQGNSEPFPVDPLVNFQGSAETTSTELVMPSSFTLGETGYVGPNMIFQTVAPEPSSLALLALGGLGLLRRRRTALSRRR